MSANKRCWSRREFLKTTGAAGFAGLLAGTDFSGTAFAAATAMPVRPFGKTGVSVPILGFGGSQNMESKQRLLRQAVKLGVTYWDTAESYGDGTSEEGMGRYLRRYSQDRKRIFLVTKSHSTRPSSLTESLDASLERLHTSYVDLFFIHSISDPEDMTDAIRIWAGQKKAEGKIRLIGFSTHRNMAECMLGAAKLGWIDGIMMTYNYRVMDSDKMKRAVDACVKAGIGLTAMKTQGGWSWGFGGAKNSATAQLMEQLADRGYSEEQAKLKAVWENPHIASICSEMPNFKILSANVAAARNQTRLSFEDKNLLNRYARETAAGYCAGCANICESALDTRIPISDTMRYLMYARSYGDPHRAMTRFRRISRRTRRQMADMDYTSAETVCPQRMPIGKLMKEALILLS